jgi:hypothetical protein
MGRVSGCGAGFTTVQSVRMFAPVSASRFESATNVSMVVGRKLSPGVKTVTG